MAPMKSNDDVGKSPLVGSVLARAEKKCPDCAAANGTYKDPHIIAKFAPNIVTQTTIVKKIAKGLPNMRSQKRDMI